MTNSPLATGALVPATFVQKGLWPDAQGRAFAARAVRVTGGLDLDRLQAAVREVHAAMPVLGVNLVERADGLMLRRNGSLALAWHDVSDVDVSGRDAACLAVLCADRDRDTDLEREPLARFHVVRMSATQIVVGLVAHRLVLDERSLYLVLGAVLEAYRGRFRRTAYRDVTELYGFSPLGPAVVDSRRRWWTRWFAAYPPQSGTDAPPDDPTPEGWTLRRSVIPGAQWRALGDAGGALRDHSSLGVAALLAWCLRHDGGRPADGWLSTVLDLREYFDLGQVVGPMTDRVVFRIDPGQAAAPSFRDVLRAAQVGIVRTATHYLPYGELVALGLALDRLRRPRTAALWDVHVHLCRHPPTSGRTRGAEVPAIAVRHLGEAALLGSGVPAPLEAWDGTRVRVHLGAVEGGDTALVLEVAGADADDGADRLLDGLRRLVRAAAADPDAPLEMTHR